jgi:hypothetical protein
MTDSRLGPPCGAEIPPNSPQGLCPKCLLQAGFESKSGPASEELAGLLPQLEILELLRKGGMRDVYKARQLSRSRLCHLQDRVPSFGKPLIEDGPTA